MSDLRGDPEPPIAFFWMVILAILLWLFKHKLLAALVVAAIVLFL